MEIRTAESLLENVAKSWKDAFYDSDNELWFNTFGCGASRKETYNKLVELESPTKQQIDDIIGNDSWTKLYCSECMGEDFPYVIVLNAWGVETENETTLCVDCFEKASDMLTDYLEESYNGVSDLPPQPPDEPEPCDCGKGIYCPSIQKYRKEYTEFENAYRNWAIQKGLTDRETLGLG